MKNKEKPENPAGTKPKAEIHGNETESQNGERSGKYRVCVYAICKNEEAFVDRWMDSMGEADLVVVTDTGSSDRTVEKLRARGAVVYEEEVKPWRFDVARNLSLSHVPEDVEICVCTDLDEVFLPGWRERVEQAWEPGTTMGKYLYNWSLKPDGTPDVQFNYFKIHSRKSFRWVCPVHEVLQYVGEGPSSTIYIDGVVLNHYPDHTKSRGSYLPLLEMAVEEDPQNDRMTYYLGREYMYAAEWNQCISTLTRYLTLPSAVWNEERCAAMRWIAKSYYRLGNLKMAFAYYYKAFAEAPHMRDAYAEFARMAYELNDWNAVLFAVSEAQKITQRSPTYVNMGYAWDSTLDDLCAIACYRLGLYTKSLEHAKKALEMDPENLRLQNNLKLIEEKIS